MIYNYHITYFLISVPTIYDLPDDPMNIEIAFIGRSNSGKSSVINALTYQKKLTKVSQTPGCTQLINLFEIKSGRHIIDFPGYGYAKGIIKRKKNYWYESICQYLKIRKNLKGLVLVMDIRNPIKNLDQEIIKKTFDWNIPILALFNKSDKISKNMLAITLRKIRNNMQTTFTKHVQIAVFSAVKKQGIESLQKILNYWFIT